MAPSSFPGSFPRNAPSGSSQQNESALIANLYGRRGQGNHQGHTPAPTASSVLSEPILDEETARRLQRLIDDDKGSELLQEMTTSRHHGRWKSVATGHRQPSQLDERRPEEQQQEQRPLRDELNRHRARQQQQQQQFEPRQLAMNGQEGHQSCDRHHKPRQQASAEAWVAASQALGLEPVSSREEALRKISELATVQAQLLHDAVDAEIEGRKMSVLVRRMP